MKLITKFDPSTSPDGTGTIDTKGVNPNEQLMLYNDAIYALKLEFADGSIDVIPALWNKDFILKNVPMGKIKWSIYNTLNIANNPLSEVYGIIYEDGEHVARVNASMQRSVVSSIPGGVSANLSSLSNVGNLPGTNWLTVQPSDVSSGTTFQADTAGNLLISGDNGGVLTQLLKTIAGASPKIQLGNGSAITEIVGTLQCDSDISLTKGSNPAINSTNTIQFQIGGTNIGQINSSGFNLNNNMKYQFISGGSISHLNYDGNTTCGSGTSISHGLGKTPDLVLLTPRIAQPGSATVGSCTWGATTFQGTVGSGTAVAWLALTAA
jgi:hypothetical protein